jgi:plasmid maintenance system antidote protein VapI
MSVPHPMLRWAESAGMSVQAIADAADCSEWHLRNICAGRKEASLGLAKRLSEVSGGNVPMDAFLKPIEARA